MSERASNDELWVALWDILQASGADVSEYAHETRTREGRSAGFREFKRRGTVAEVVAAVEELRKDYDETPDSAAPVHDDCCEFRAVWADREPEGLDCEYGNVRRTKAEAQRDLRNGRRGADPPYDEWWIERRPLSAWERCS